MAAARTLLFIASAAAAALSLPAHAQSGTGTGFQAPHGWAVPGTRSYLGLHVSPATLSQRECITTSLLCPAQERSAQMYAGTMLGRNWGAELSFVDTGRILRSGSEARGQGLNVSLIGQARPWANIGVFGKVGTTFGRTETSVTLPAAPALGTGQGFGLSWGGGVSYEITPRLSATFEVESHDLRFAGGSRDPVTSGSLGLKYRY